jgi:hypothetical protein
MKRSVQALVLALLTSSGLPAAILAHRYSFNTVDEAVDSVGGNDGVLLNGASVDGTHLILPGTGVGGGAANMGFSNFIDIGVNFGASGVTIETWYTDDGSGVWGKLFTFGTSAAGQEIAFTNRRGGGDLAPGLDRNGAKFLANYPQGSNTYITQGEEHHLVVAVADDGTTSLWVDGSKEIDSIATNPLSNVVTNTESIGATAWNDPGHLGTVNEFRIWSGTLTDDEVQANFLSGPNVLPAVGDGDGDGLPDAWEQQWFNNPVSPELPGGNPDNDGLTNLEEFQFNILLDPTKPDTDGDGLTDGVEVNTSMTNPLAADTDGDTLTDGAEVNTHMTNPRSRDTDGDRYSDAREVADGTNPLDPNSPPPLTQPALAHRYSFLLDATDSVGGNDGVLIGDAHVEGGQLVLDGIDDRMDFTNVVGVGDNFGPTGISIETWYTDAGSGTWAKLFSFGSPAAGQELAYTNRRGNGESSGIDRDGAKLFGFDVTQNEEHYLAFTVSADGNLNGYLDGAPLDTITDLDTNDLSNVTSTNEFIGESAWTVDPGHLGSINEFRIWKGVLSADQTAQNYQNGPDVIGGAAAPFVITSVLYDSASGRPTIVWNSVAGRRYTIHHSDTLAGWTQIPGEVTAQGPQTSFTDTTIPAGTGTRFYRVRQEP